MTTVYPVSLDTLNNPTSSTNRDDAGFELDVVISNLNDAVEALQTKLGIGASFQSALINNVMVGTGTGQSRWEPGLSSAYLATNAVTNIALISDATAASTTSPTQVDITGMTRTWTTGGGDILAILLASCSNPTIGSIHSLALRLDSGSDIGAPPILAHVANYGILHAAIAYFTSVSAASHTVKGRWATSGGTINRAGTHYLLAAEIKK